MLSISKLQVEYNTLSKKYFLRKNIFISST